jgi:hypothetical protein
MRHERNPKTASHSPIIAKSYGILALQQTAVQLRPASPSFSLLPTLLGDDAVLLVDVDDELHLVVGAEEDTAAVVDALGDDCEHAGHVAVHCLAAGCERKEVSIAELVD